MFHQILITLILLTQTAINQKLICNNRALRVLDANVARIVTLGQSANSGRRFPENKEELKFFCNDTYKTILEVENYKNQCMQNLPKQITSVILYTIKNMINSLCKKDSKRLKSLLEASPCSNKANNEFNKCNVGYIDKLLGTIHAEEKKRIPHICCEYYKLFNCLTERGNNFEECRRPNVMLTIHDFVRQIFQGSVDILCGEWTEDSDKCYHLPPPPKKRKGQKRTQSFMIPFIDVLNSIPEIPENKQ